MELTAQVEDKMIMQHNAITSGRYDFSACQLDILFMLLAILDEKDAPNKEYNISVKDIETITGREWNYQQLRDSTAELGSRMFEIETAESLTQFWLFVFVKYYTGTGSFRVKISLDIRPLFFDLKNNFTVMQLKSVLSCSSKYAKRLYAIACQWRRAGGVVYEIKELKMMLGLIDPKTGKEQFKRISAFKDRVLDVAKKQINENTDITFDYQLIKRGHSYHKIKLFTGAVVPEQLSIDFKQDLEEQKKNAELLRKVKSIKAYGIREDLAQLWAVKYWKEFVAEKNTLIDIMTKGKVIDNKAAYLVGVFKTKSYL